MNDDATSFMNSMPLCIDEHIIIDYWKTNVFSYKSTSRILNGVSTVTERY
jgi:hypothetical protein